MESREIEVDTGARPGLVDLTDAARRFLADVAGEADGLLHVFVPHATAGVCVMELTADTERDALETLSRLVPRDDRWRHRHGSMGHGADHVLPLIVGPAVSVPVVQGRLALGTWQAIALVDLNVDNPRRRVRFSFLRA